MRTYGNLVLTTRLSEPIEIHVEDVVDIYVTPTLLQPGQVRLLFQAPRWVEINRRRVAMQKVAEREIQAKAVMPLHERVRRLRERVDGLLDEKTRNFLSDRLCKEEGTTTEAARQLVGLDDQWETER